MRYRTYDAASGEAAGDILLGTAGAVVGGFLFHQGGVPPGGGPIGALVVATIGAVVVLVLVRRVKRA